MADQGIQLLGQLAVQFRTLQLNAHNFHNLCAGETFFSDHSFFGEMYGKAEGWYDDMCERLIGSGNTPNLLKIQQMAVESLVDVTDTDGMFEEVSSEVDSIIQAIEQSPELGLSQGTMDLLYGIANDLEVVKYKVNQRTAG